MAMPNGIGLEGDFVSVSVSDTGEGIEPKLVERVFEPFFTTKEVGKGTGLGLSQVYGFARQAGGTAEVQSNLGQGTTVTLYLPRSHCGPEKEGTSPRLAPSKLDLGLALAVDDNAQVAEVTKLLLEGAGYTVVSAHDYSSAIHIVDEHHADLKIVLTDIVMPGKANGLDLARWLREHYPNLPVVLATGYSSNARAAEAEGFKILSKPYNSEQLAAAIKELGKGDTEATHRPFPSGNSLQ
jgi:two-component system NtrC family sensor kinase